MASDRKKIRVFISYAREDSKLKERLLDHFSAMIHSGLLEIWHDRLTLPGTHWENEIDERLSTSDIVLLLVSPSFMGSGYCTGYELKKAMMLHDSKKVVVIPVVLRPVDLTGTDILHLNALPPAAKPVTEWDNRDRALMETAQEIRKLITAIQINSESDKGPISEYRRLLKDHTYYLNNTSFLRLDKQREFQARTGVPVNHYDIRVVVDSYHADALDLIDHVDYLLDETYPQSIQSVFREKDGKKTTNFMLPELAFGEYLLFAKLHFRDGSNPVILNRYITLWDSGPLL